MWMGGTFLFSGGLFAGGLRGEPRRTNLGLTYLNPNSPSFRPDWQITTHFALVGGCTMLARLQSPGLRVWIQSNPVAVAWTGFLCILVSLCVLAIWRIGYRPSKQSLAAKNQAEPQITNHEITTTKYQSLSAIK
jgi:hypothetical protein